MAMTKKERAAHDAEIDKLTLRLALCWTPEIKPDVPHPVNDIRTVTKMTKGWKPFFDRVEASCSTSCNHGRFQTTKVDSQQPVDLFSTRLLALRALRHDMEERFARELRRIDDWIEQEKANPTPLPEK